MQGPASVSSASYMTHPETDDIISEASITPGSDTPVTTPSAIPRPSPQSPLVAGEESHHGSHSASRDTPPKYSPQTAQRRELKAASYDNMTKRTASPPLLRAHDAPSPYLGPAGHQRPRRKTANRTAYFSDEGDSNEDVDCVDSQDDKHPLKGDEGGVSDEDEQPACKRRKSSMPSTTKMGSEASRVVLSHRVVSPSRFIRRSVEGREHVRTTSPVGESQSNSPVLEAPLRCTTSTANVEATSRLPVSPDLSEHGGCLTYLNSQAALGLPLLGRTEEILPPDSISTIRHRNKTSPGLEDDMGPSGKALWTTASVRSEASPLPVQYDTLYRTGTRRHNLSEAGRSGK